MTVTRGFYHRRLNRKPVKGAIKRKWTPIKAKKGNLKKGGVFGGWGNPFGL